MTKGTRAFRIIISVLLGLTMLWTAYISYAFIYVTKENNELRRQERYGIYVAGTHVTRGNCHDILGDGAVSYNPDSNRLTLRNATIACEGSAIYSDIDLTIVLEGENKLISSGKELTYGLYASDYSLRKDLCILGDGTLEIIVEDDGCLANAGIVAGDVWIDADVSISLANAEDSSTGISCKYLSLDEERNLSVKVGSAENSTGIFVRGNLYLDEGSVVDVTGAAATKESMGIECNGNLTAKENASVTSVSGGEYAGIICYNSILDYGADFQCEIDATDGIRDMK